MNSNNNKTAVRLEVDKNFTNRKNNPHRIDVGETTWEVYRALDEGIIILKEGKQEYAFRFEEGVVFLMEDYCYYRYKEFQLLLDSFHIDKVKRVKPEETITVSLICGVKELAKSFTVFSNGGINVLGVKNINEGKSHQTQLYKIEFERASWAIVDTKNTRFSYRTLYCWNESPHLLLKELNKSGLGLPKLAS